MKSTGTATSTLALAEMRRKSVVKRALRNRVEGNVLGQRAHGLAAHGELDDRVEEVAGAKLAAQFLFFNVDRDRILIAAVDHGGSAAFAAQCSGGSLASPIARLGRQMQRFAHLYLYLHVLVEPIPSRHASRDDHARGEAAALSGYAEKKQARAGERAGAVPKFALSRIFGQRLPTSRA